MSPDSGNSSRFSTATSPNSENNQTVGHVRPSSTWTPRRPLEVQRVELTAAQPSQRLPVVAPANQSVLFIVYLGAGQQLDLRLQPEQGRASLRISGADASLLLDERAESDHWAGTLPSGQDYLVEVIALDGLRFAGFLELTLVVAAGTTTPIAAMSYWRD